jgi:hypothetical protein
VDEQELIREAREKGHIERGRQKRKHDQHDDGRPSVSPSAQGTRTVGAAKSPDRALLQNSPILLNNSTRYSTPRA